MQVRDLVGTVMQVQRYPVKSMGVDSLQEGDLHWTGLAGDRQYAFVKTSSRNRFPYLTARDVPNMLLYKAHYLKPDDPRTSALAIRTPTGVNYEIDDPALCAELAEAAGEPVHLMQLGRGHFDSAPVSIITTTNAARLAHAHGNAIDLQRFRINIVVEPANPDVWDRDWLSQSLAFGNGQSTASLRVDIPIERCQMITLDPGSAKRDVSIMRTVAQKFSNEIGMYCAVQAAGMIKPGDAVHRCI